LTGQKQIKTVQNLGNAVYHFVLFIAAF